MQYKQVPRIVVEICTPNALLETRLAGLCLLASLVNRPNLPKLGPYRKRSPEQALWRIASDCERDPEERWIALQNLLRIGQIECEKEGATLAPDGVEASGR
jgi:hypothetical protein